MNRRPMLRTVVFALAALMLFVSRAQANPASLDVVFAPDQTGTELKGWVRGAAAPSDIALGGVVGDGAVSPDGRRIVFLEVLGDDIALGIAHADGSGKQKLLGMPAILCPSWSPDGKLIVFTRLDPATRKMTLYTVGADGKDLKTVKVDAIPDVEQSFALVKPHLSRDGRSILAATVVRRGGALLPLVVVIDRATGKVRELTRGLDPAWSPDGRRLAFVAVDDQGRGHLSVAAADGSKPRALGLKGAFAPVWSPDGKRLYFNVMQDGELAVWSADADGSKPARVDAIPGGALLSSTSKQVILKYMEMRGKK